ncbi:MAG: AEC family transporter [Kordiimonadaceae bacterium]|nr:AEC family transporter [Kordiimonadaceae bacterium]
MADIVTIIAPVFLIMMLGYGLGKTRLFPEGSSAVLITFVWYVAIPALIFRAVAPKDFPQGVELLLLAAYYASVFFVYGLTYVFARAVFKLSSAEGGIFSLVTCFGNGVFIGVPIVEGLYGEEGVRLLLVILSFHSISLLSVTTIIVERDLNEDGGGTAAKIFESMRQNPIIVALAGGLVWSALSLPFPYWLDRLVSLPAQAASPVGLFAAGLALSNVRVAGNLSHSLFAVSLKLLILPVMTFFIALYVAGLPDLWVGVATVAAALPSGMIGYSFASQYGLGTRRAATAVLISTVISIFTLTGLLLLLQADVLF